MEGGKADVAAFSTGSSRSGVEVFKSCPGSFDPVRLHGSALSRFAAQLM